MTAKIFSIASIKDQLYPTKINLELQYKPNLLEICGEYDQDEGYDDDAHTAELILDDENIHDPNAVRVDIDDLPIGYLSKPDALLYRQHLAELQIAAPAVGMVTAHILGLKQGENPDFVVRLAFLPASFQIEKLEEITPLIVSTRSVVQDLLGTLPASPSPDSPTDPVSSENNPLE